MEQNGILKYILSYLSYSFVNWTKIQWSLDIMILDFVLSTKDLAYIFICFLFYEFSSYDNY